MNKSEIDVPANLVRKWRKLFHYRDTDHDGVITKADYDKYAERFVDVYGKRAAPTREIKDLLWDTASAAADKNGVTEQGYVDSFSYLWKHDRKSFMGKIEKYCNLCFDAIDVNSDGNISRAEYGMYQNCFGISNESYIDHIFAQLDVNSDGGISRIEFVQPIMDYVFKDALEDIPEMYDAEKALNFSA